VYKGVNFREHAQLYDSLCKTVNDPSNNFMDRIQDKQEKAVIAHTKANISREDQINGKLIQRSSHDAIIINEAASKFFTLVNDICRKAELATTVPIIPSISIEAKKKNIISGKLIPGVVSIAHAKRIDHISENQYSTTIQCQPRM
jgi:hypothetical protein